MVVVQNLKYFKGIIFKVIGIKEWLLPQISEHWPYIKEGSKTIKLIQLIRPGTESAFTPRLGIVQACKTSEEEIRSWIGVLVGILTTLSVSKSRKCLLFDVSIKLSNSKVLKLLYS